MHISLACCESGQQVWLHFDVPETACVREAIEESGVLDRFPELDIASRKVGIFGKLVKLDAGLKSGDRIEIYRPITADPETVPRKDVGDAD